MTTQETLIAAAVITVVGLLLVVIFQLGKSENRANREREGHSMDQTENRRIFGGTTEYLGSL